MPKDDILLIQGPPGTGKTHTIIGIISMLMSSILANSNQKIMICAPSNAAIDQIIMRIIEKGLIGMIGLKRTKKVSKKQEEKKKHHDESSDSSSEEEENSNQDLS
jgi:superfamily I DNA and/or RNA helicase